MGKGYARHRVKPDLADLNKPKAPGTSSRRHDGVGRVLGQAGAEVLDTHPWVDQHRDGGGLEQGERQGVEPQRRWDHEDRSRPLADPDPAQTTRLIDLANLKERVHQLEAANQGDQQRIFATYRKFGPASDENARLSLNREIGDIQLQMARRGQEQKALHEQIDKLEAAMGVPSEAPK